VKSVTRATLLLALLMAYVIVTVRPALVGGSGRGLDVLAPESRYVERAIGEHRFADALPVAVALRRAHVHDPLIAYWLVIIYEGLGRDADARAAWDDFERLSGASRRSASAHAD
jgi:hypothetical protein